MRRMLIGSGGHVPQERREVLIKETKQLFGPTVKKFLLVPYALTTHQLSVEEFYELGFNAGYEVDSLHTHEDDPLKAVEEAEAIYVDGGNIFRLSCELYKRKLIEPIRKKVLSGTPYIGLSAGGEFAGPTIRTTNDMPIVMPPSFNALNLVPFQLNSHYFTMGITPEYRGETRERKIEEYHEEEDSLPVVSMREGSILRVIDNNITICGTVGVKLFNRKQQARDYFPEDTLDFLMHQG